MAREKMGPGAAGTVGFLPVALALAAGSVVALPVLAQPAPSPAPSGAAPAPAVDVRSALRNRLSGFYRPAPGAPNAARRDAAVERAVDALFLLIQPIARSRLTDANPVFPSVRIAFFDGQVDIATPPIAGRSPEDGGERTIRGLDGNTNRLVQTLTSDSLIQNSWREEGSRTTRFSLAPDNSSLSLHIQVRSPRLPVPVRYTLSYVRSNR